MIKQIGLGILALSFTLSLSLGNGNLVHADASAAKTVSFLYFNDGHEINPVADKLGTRGGVARIKTLIDSVAVR